MRGRRALGLLIAPMVLLAACSSGGAAGPDAGTGEPGAPATGPAPPPDAGERTEEPTAATDAPPEDAPVQVTIAAAGDILPHSWVNRSANAYAGGGEGEHDFGPMFADVAGLISSADLALCHLETPLSADGTGLSVPNTLSFNSPREVATALADAGFDGCDFASNHTLDRGLAGLAETVQVLTEEGLGYAGPAPEQDRAGRAEIYDVDGVRVAHLAYTYTYPNSGSPTTTIPPEAPWLREASWPVLGAEGILGHAVAARDDGADFVVLSMHWGAEYQTEPTTQQRELAEQLLSSGEVDLILGTHVHVVQPCERIEDRIVLYGLGNFLSNQSPTVAPGLRAATQDGMVATISLRRDGDGVVSSTMTYQPTFVEIPPEIVPGHIIRKVSPQSHPESWDRTVGAVDLLGGCGAEPTPGDGR